MTEGREIERRLGLSWGGVVRFTLGREVAMPACEEQLGPGRYIAGLKAQGIAPDGKVSIEIAEPYRVCGCVGEAVGCDRCRELGWPFV